MGWVLVLVSCVAATLGPVCTAEIRREMFVRQSDCAEAAVDAHDALRRSAEAEGVILLSLDTRCLVIGSALFEGAL